MPALQDETQLVAVMYLISLQREHARRERTKATLASCKPPIAVFSWVLKVFGLSQSQIIES